MEGKAAERERPSERVAGKERNEYERGIVVDCGYGELGGEIIKSYRKMDRCV